MATKKSQVVETKTIEPEPEVQVKSGARSAETIQDTSQEPKKGLDLRNNSLAREIASKQPMLVSGTNIKTINGQSLLGSGNLAVDGHFKGWYNTLEELKAAHTAVEGDSAYVKDASPATTWSIYVYDATATTDNNWADSGTDADTSNVQTFASGEEVNETPIDDTHLANAPEGSLPLATDTQLLAQKLRGVDLEETKVPVVTSGDGQNVFAGYIDGSVGGYHSSSNNVFIVVPLNGDTKVRWLGKENTVNNSHVGWAFGTFSGEIDATLSNFMPISRGIYANDSEGNKAVEYIKDAPEGATHAVITIWKYSSGVNSAVTLDNFYCYLENGNTVLQTIEKSQDLLVYGGTITKVLLPIKTLTDFRITGGDATSVQVGVTTPGSGTSATTVFFKVVKGTNLHIVIPKTGNEYTKVWAYFTNIPSPITQTTTVQGSLVDDTAGNSSAKTLDINVDTDYQYIGVTFKTTTDMPTASYSLVINGLKSDEEAINEYATFPIEQTKSIIGENGLSITADSLSDGETLTTSKFPYSNKIGDKLSLFCKVTSFGAVSIQRGTDTSAYGVKVVIDATNVSVYYVNSSQNQSLVEQYAHGLTIASILGLNIQSLESGKLMINIVTVGGSNTHTTTWSSYFVSGKYKVVSTLSSLSDVKLSLTNNRFRCPLWVFGASYEGIADSRWAGQAKNLGYTEFLNNGFPGRGSETTYNDLLRALNFGCPKYLYWTMFGNGTAASLGTYLNLVHGICQQKGIEMIIINRPNSPGVTDYSDRKAAIDAMIALGVRYVDMSAAVSSNPLDADSWYPGFLDNDGLHPTEMGAKAICARVLTDLPEIMQYGIG